MFVKLVRGFGYASTHFIQVCRGSVSDHNLHLSGKSRSKTHGKTRKAWLLAPGQIRDTGVGVQQNWYHLGLSNSICYDVNDAPLQVDDVQSCALFSKVGITW